MVVRYFNIKSKPNVQGFAVKAEVNENLERTTESLNSEDVFVPFFCNRTYSHFELIDGDYTVLGDKGDPLTLHRGGKRLANVCVDNSGNLNLYKNEKKLLVNEINEKQAEQMIKDARNWRMLQSWV